MAIGSGRRSLLRIPLSVGIILGIILVCGPRKALSAEINYRMDDLEILAQDHAWPEYLAHALDVRPSERQERWKELTLKVGINYLKQIIAAQDYTTATWDRVFLANNIKVLADDEIYQMQRALWGKAYFAHHFAQTPRPSVYQQFKVFWQSTPAIPATLDAVYALAITLPSADPQLDLWPLWSRLVQSSAAETYCARPAVQKALWQQLQTMANFEQALALAQPDCWRAAQNILKENIYLSPYPYQILTALGLLAPGERQQYLANYLLRDSPNGKVFDEAWAFYLQLGKSYELRQQVLGQLKGQPFLPDQLWGTDDLRRQQAVFYHVEQNFPEYIAYYLQTCLAFYEGSRSFPQGSPVMYCRDFYRMAKSNHLINEGLQSRFEGLALKF